MPSPFSQPSSREVNELPEAMPELRSRPVLGSTAHSSAGGRLDASESAALRHLHEVHRPVLLAYITRLMRGDVHRAEDILQETLLRAWRNPQARGVNGKWSRAWLFTVARRITIDYVRSVQVRPAEYFDERIDSHADKEDEIERLLDSQEVRAALTSLPDRLRTILIEIYFEERSVSEAAEMLDVPTGTVKSRTFYALRALREALAERGFVFGNHRTNRPDA